MLLSGPAQRLAADLATWRQHLHAHPELSFAEYETTAWLCKKMEEWGIPFTRPTPTGLVAEILGDRPGRTVAVRADIDALPIHEETDLACRSTRPNVMHACGHDGHTAILLGLARWLSQHRAFPGRVRLLFQSAEEVPPGGAQAFIQAGVLDGVSACIGLHLMSDLPTGQASVASGPMMANSDRFRARIQGRGGHGAAPHQTIDAVVVACNAVLNLQPIVARKIDPARPAVVTVGAIHGGTTFNVIADAVDLQGTVRSFDSDIRKQLHDEVRRTLEATCQMYGAGLEFDFQWGYPALINHPEIAEVLREAARAVLGDDQVQVQEPIMGGEDFAYYAQHLPAAFLFVGCQNASVGADWPHHHPRFTIDEGSLPIGLEIMIRATLALLE